MQSVARSLTRLASQRVSWELGQHHRPSRMLILSAVVRALILLSNPDSTPSHAYAKPALSRQQDAEGPDSHLELLLTSTLPLAGSSKG